MKIQGFFSSIKEAQKVVEELKKAGFHKATFDINEQQEGGLENAERNIAGSENGSSLSSLVLEEGEPVVDGSKAPIAAANPMASGMAGFDEIANYQYKVVVEANDKSERQIKDMIESKGGTLENPNAQNPEGLENIDMWEMVEKMSRDTEMINRQDNMFD